MTDKIKQTDDNGNPLPKGVFVVNGKIYAQCPACRGLVRLNKPIFGGLHICD